LDGRHATAGHEPPTQRRSTTATFLPELTQMPGQQLSSLATAKYDGIEELGAHSKSWSIEHLQRKI
jgi:hypothetical protein